MPALTSLILFLPLASFVLIPFVPEKKRILGGWLATLSMTAAFFLALKLAMPLLRSGRFDRLESSFPWIVLPNLKFEFGFLVDSLSCLMLLIVTGVGALIFYYSLEYMEHDKGFRRYYAGLCLFAFSMLGIVLSNNLAQLFIFWELVGFSSYLLIGHWYEKADACEAGKKAFLTNRVADFGFLIGILLLWSISNPAESGDRTLNFLRLEELLHHHVSSGLIPQSIYTVAMMLIFMGIMGKSAQFPLHVWLPDAMEGPTPVSALIHAATMVAAGVYLLARTFALFTLAPFALHFIAILGGVTAILSATQAVVQNDIKKILAYSTLSQLGYMVMAIGLGGVSAGVYHLATHAFFKALLFLAAGSVIHATETHDIFLMGGLFRKLPFTSIVFAIGTFALLGIWPFSGFWSKEEILSVAFTENKMLFLISAATVFLTSLYMGRLILITFFGPSKIKEKLSEPSLTMLLPLAILAILSVSAGFFGIGHWVHYALEKSGEKNSFVVILSNVFVALGLLTAFLFYGRARSKKSGAVQARHSFILNIVLNKYYIDALYDWVLTHVQTPFSKLLDWFERIVIVKGAVGGTAKQTLWLGNLVRKSQTGKIEASLFWFGIGVSALLFYFVVLGRPV